MLSSRRSTPATVRPPPECFTPVRCVVSRRLPAGLRTRRPAPTLPLPPHVRSACPRVFLHGGRSAGALVRALLPLYVLSLLCSDFSFVCFRLKQFGIVVRCGIGVGALLFPPDYVYVPHNNTIWC